MMLNNTNNNNNINKNENENNELNIIRSMWEIPSAFYYLTFFKEPLGLIKNLTIDDMENSLMTPSNSNSFTILSDLFIHLMKNVVKTSMGALSNTNWEIYLRKEIEKKTNPIFLELYPEGDNPFIDEHFAHITDLSKRVQLLKACCDWNLRKSKAVLEYINGNYVSKGETDYLRQQPVGVLPPYNYWYFGDCRLYKETIQPQPLSRKRSRASIEIKPNKWEVVCNTKEEWEALIKTLQEDKEKDEGNEELEDLHLAISELLAEVLPKLIARKRKATMSNRATTQLNTQMKFITRSSANTTDGNNIEHEYGGMRLRPRTAARLPFLSNSKDDDSSSNSDKDDNDDEDEDDEDEVDTRLIKTRRTQKQTHIDITPAYTSSGRRISQRTVDEYGLPTFVQKENVNNNNNRCQNSFEEVQNVTDGEDEDDDEDDDQVDEKENSNIINIDKEEKDEEMDDIENKSTTTTNGHTTNGKHSPKVDNIQINLNGNNNNNNLLNK